MSDRYLAYFRTAVREQLVDEEFDYLEFTDPEIDRAIQDAVWEASEYQPREVTTVHTMATTVKAIDLTDLVVATTETDITPTLLRVYRVEYPVDSDPQTFLNFTLWGNVLTLESEAKVDEDVAIWWFGRHELTDTSTTLTAVLERILVEGATARALINYGTNHINDINIGGPGSPAQLIQAGETKWAKFVRDLTKKQRKFPVEVEGGH